MKSIVKFENKKLVASNRFKGGSRKTVMGEGLLLFRFLVTKNLLFVLIILGSIKVSFGQPSKGYYSLISKSENYIIQNKYEEAIRTYQDAFEKYQYPFYKHIRQAAIVACLEKDTIHLIPLLKQCVVHGMTKNELDFFRKELPSSNRLSEFIKLFDFYEREYEQSIDSSVLIPFLEFDVLQTAMLNGKMRKLRRKKALMRLNFENKKFLGLFNNLLDSLGFPSENVVGLTYSFKIRPKWWPLKGFKSTSIDGSLAEKYSVKYSYAKDFLRYKSSSIKPGLWGLTHLAAVIDSSFIDRLRRCFDSLQIDQDAVAICLSTHVDMAAGRYSPFNLRTRFKLRARYSISNVEKEILDTNRQVYYFRSLYKEKSLFEALHYKKYQKRIRDFDKAAKEMQYIYSSFFRS